MERRLIDYLPHVVRQYDVLQGIMAGQQPEFDLVWDAHELAFTNQFIDTATDYGLGRWEKMLNLHPGPDDTYDSRRVAIKTKLNTMIPYTYRVLIQSITALANGSPFTVTLPIGSYLLKIVTEWDKEGQMEALRDLLDQMLPANIAVDSKNDINATPDSPLVVISALGFCEVIALSDAGNEFIQLEADVAVPVVPALCELIPLDDAGDEHFSLATDLAVPLVPGICAVIPLTDAGDEHIDLQAKSIVPTGVVLTETINLYM